MNLKQQFIGQHLGSFAHKGNKKILIKKNKQIFIK
jgi:hypothetical protein